MSVIKKEDRILEAIDQLRRRKARPDADRICNFLLRRFNIDKIESVLLLNSLIDCDPPKVIKVIYKGFTSYRRPSAAKTKNQTDYSAILTSALSELIVEEPDYLDFGVPPDEFQKFLISKDKNKFTKRNVNSIIQAEIDKGNLVSLETGNLSLVDSNSSNLESMENSPFKSSASNNSTPTKNMAQEITNNLSLGSEEMDEKVRDIILGTEKADKKPKKANINSKKGKINDRKRKVVEDKSKTLTEDIDEPKVKEIRLESEGFRDGVRRKRAAKKVFDPSEVTAPQLASKKRGRPPAAGKKVETEPTPTTSAAEDQTISGVFGKPKGGVCCVCHSLGPADKLITCQDCSNRAHPGCTERKHDASNTAPWQCLHCKTCCVCCETDEYAPMIVCSLCDDGYHFSCHVPQVAYKPKVAWVCLKCLDAAAKMKSESNLAGNLAQRETRFNAVAIADANAVTGRAQPVATAACEVKAAPSPVASPPASPLAGPSSSSGVSSGSSGDRDGDVDHRVPDASSWSVDQVANYIAERGYPEQAAAFRENEIDGTSLLLMKRSDVLSGLRLKLGPALKAYKQVKRLQIRRSELHLLWA